jgi:hypothetical protein
MAGRKTYPFKPDWCIAPAATLQEWLDEMNLSVEVLAVGCGPKGPVRDHCLARLRAILAREPMTEEDVQIAAKATMIPPGMWRGLEHNYRAGLAAGLPDTTE